jgi:hypothetical protein
MCADSWGDLRRVEAGLFLKEISLVSKYIGIQIHGNVAVFAQL